MVKNYRNTDAILKSTVVLYYLTNYYLIFFYISSSCSPVLVYFRGTVPFFLLFLICLHCFSFSSLTLLDFHIVSTVGMTVGDFSPRTRIFSRAPPSRMFSSARRRGTRFAFCHPKKWWNVFLNQIIGGKKSIDELFWNHNDLEPRKTFFSPSFLWRKPKIINCGHVLRSHLVFYKKGLKTYQQIT